jgi:hypothetical protein
MRDGRMHQTTVRFGPDLWEALEVECASLGVSAAQYLREAALARLAYTAGRRGDPDYEEALVRSGAKPGVAQESPATTEAAHARAAQTESSEQVLAATAVTAQSELVWRRAREVREQAAELRRRRRENTS